MTLPMLRDLAGEGAAKNVCCSPLSAHGALMLTWEGAQGQTAGELAAALGLPAGWDHARAHAACGALQRELVHAPSVKVRLANAVWAQKGLPWKQTAKDALAKSYAAPFFDADFMGDPAGEAKRMNAWASDQTAGRIKRVVGLEDMKDLRLALANALYFKGDWEFPFKKEGTRRESFTQTDGKQAPAMLMYRQVEGVGYAENDAEQILELPYEGGQFGMVVVLPRQGDGLPGLLAKADAKTLDGWMTALKPEPKVAVALPKWRIEASHDLIPVLAGLGVKELFDHAHADLHGFAKTTPEGNLFVGMVRQNVFCEVDEVGTEAAAVTMVGVKCATAPRPEKIKVFRADHPFLYFLRDRKSGAILFAGVMAMAEEVK